MNTPPKVLFILKRREDFNAVIHNKLGLSTGLFNSASFVSNMLADKGVDTKLVVVADNNDIDRECNAYKPTHVIIEALWVVPTKFTILQKLHHTITWVIRLHSEMPFMAGEGMAMDWLGDYSKFKNIVIGVNAPRMMAEVKFYLKLKNGWTEEEAAQKVVYLPNHYPSDYKAPKKLDKKKDTVDIGCFGAVRPLKNHLLQAFASIQFADKIGKKLRFHVNAGRIEMKGEPMLNNLRGLFEQIYHTGHEMVNHQWSPHEEFVQLCGEMDLGLQVSFSETFNIVGADLISQGVPIVGSTEIPWAHGICCADPTNTDHIVQQMRIAYRYPWMNVKLNQLGLTEYAHKTAKIWYKYFTTQQG